MKRPLWLLLLLIVFAGLGWLSAVSAAQPSEPVPTFVPSEKLPADGAVSFPVDI